MNAIACVDLNWGLGKDGNLLYHIPEDLEFFKNKTKGKVIIYGNSTLKSFPGGKPLKDRINIVITTNMDNISKEAIDNSCPCTNIDVQSKNNLTKLKSIINHNKYIDFNIFNYNNYNTINFNDKPILLIATSIKQAVEFARLIAYDSDIWVCGGASIYKQMLSYIDTFWITKVYSNTNTAVDVYLSNLDNLKDEDGLPYFIPVQVTPNIPNDTTNYSIYSFICYRERKEYIGQIKLD